jgi:DNA-binding NarL/FixJ family response regulator
VGHGTERSAQDRLALDVLTAALALSLWVAAGSLVLAVANGLGADPVRRLLVGALLVAALAAAIWRRRAVCAVLRARPWLVIVVAALELTAAIADQAIGGPYVACSLTALGLAVVAARARTVWLCVALLSLGYATAVLVQRSPARLADDGDLGGVIGVLVSYVFAAAVLLALRWLLARYVAHAPQIVAGLRAGAPALTPALDAAIARPGGPLLLPAAPARNAGLTPTEIRIVEGLASGTAPKQLAREMDVVLATVRTHIRNAKRKTGARTLRELAGLAAAPEWPLVERLR